MNQTRDFQLKVKGLDPAGTFTGYASTYGNEDLVGDVVAPGAFRQSIQSQGNGYPLLWSHNTAEPIGIAKVSDSTAGLVVNGTLVMQDPAAQRAYHHLKAGSIRGLSIGFQVPEGRGKAEFQSDGTRLLKEIRLHEISLVVLPANPKAIVGSVKSLVDISRVLANLRRDDVDRKTLLSISASLRRLLDGAKDDEDECQCECPECQAGDCADCSNEDCEDPNCGADDDDDPDELAAVQRLARELQAAA